MSVLKRIGCNPSAFLAGLLCIAAAMMAMAEGSSSTNLFPVCNDLKWGYMDRTGKVVVPMLYSHAEPFSEGVGVAGFPGIYYIFDSSGKKVVKLQTEAHTANKIQEGLILVDELWFKGIKFFDRSGQQAFPLGFEDAKGFSCGLAAVKLDDKWGYIDKGGAMIISNRYDLAMPFSDDVAHVCLKEKWGIIDKTGKYLIEPRYDKMSNFHAEGLSAVCNTGSWSFVDRSGELKIPGQFEQARHFSEGVASVTVNGKAGYIDHAGRFVVLSIFDAARDFSEGFAAVKKEGRWGYVNHDGEQVIRPQFKEVLDFQYGLARVQTDAQWGYIDKVGDFVWKDAPTPMARLKLEWASMSPSSPEDVIFVFSEAANEKERNEYVSYYAKEALTEFVIYDNGVYDSRYVFAVRFSPGNPKGFLATYNTSDELCRVLVDSYRGVTNSTAYKPWVEGVIPELTQEVKDRADNP